MGKFQPGEWKDVGEVTGNEELKGVQMPVGPLKDLQAYSSLYYNEVRSAQWRGVGAQPFEGTAPLRSNFGGYADSSISHTRSQYIVYDTAQIRLRYLLEVKM